MANILELKNLTKIYREGNTEVKVLHGVTLGVNSGEFIVFIGPSGSGKSTLLNLIALLDNATSGDIIFEGKNIAKLAEVRRAKLRLNKFGFVFQFDGLLPEFSVLENVLMPSIIKGKRDITRAKYLLNKFGILDLQNKLPPSLSGGEKQRVALARAMINKPALLLADEPTGNLDTARKEQIFKDFALAATEGTTILMVTHDIHAVNFASRCFKLEDGCVHEFTSEH